MTSKKTLRNIRSSFQLDTIQRHINDQQSLMSSIMEWEKDGKNLVLYKKMQGTLEEYPLAKEDFMIVLQNDVQKEVLQLKGGEGICCDSTHGTTGYDFNLTSLLCIDEWGEGFPVAWCLSSHETEEFMAVFFTKVRENAGVTKPMWFMSDMAEQFYTAFARVNECQPKQLFCTWHVDRAWRKELHLKVPDTTISKAIYLFLRTVLEITDKEEFETVLQQFCEYLQNDADLVAFAEYFESEYVPKKEQWAYCYRRGDGINTNMFVESFHRNFKYQYLKAKYNKRADVCLVNLVKYGRDLGVERIIKFTQGKNSSRIHDIDKHHTKSEELKDDTIEHKEGDVYIVKSKTKKGINYEVTKVLESCADDCYLKCSVCKVCPHNFTCTCPSFIIYHYTCKHCHLVKTYISKREGKDDQHNNEAAQEDYSSKQIQKTLNALATPTLKTNKSTDDLRDEIKHQLLNIQSKISNPPTDYDALNTLLKGLKANSSTFDSLCQSTAPVLPVKLKSPPNKCIAPQRKFHSVKLKKKANKSQKTNKFQKPTYEQRNAIIRTCQDQNPNKFGRLSQVLDSQEKTTEDTSIQSTSNQEKTVPQKKSNKARQVKLKKDLQKLSMKARQVKTSQDKTSQDPSIQNVSNQDKVVPQKPSPEMRKLFALLYNKKMIWKGKLIANVPEVIEPLIIEEDYTILKPIFTIEAYKKLELKICGIAKEWTCPKCNQASSREMVLCEKCKIWYHHHCVGVSVSDIEGDIEWICHSCQIPTQDATVLDSSGEDDDDDDEIFEQDSIKDSSSEASSSDDDGDETDVFFRPDSCSDGNDDNIAATITHEQNSEQETLHEDVKDKSNTESSSDDDTYFKMKRHPMSCEVKTTELIPYLMMDRNTVKHHDDPLYMNKLETYIETSHKIPTGLEGIEGSEQVYQPITVHYDVHNGTAIVWEGNHRITAVSNLEEGDFPEFVHVRFNKGNLNYEKNAHKLNQTPKEWPTRACGCYLGFTTKENIHDICKKKKK